MSSLPPGRSQPPVAVRVVRPFESEDALLAAEASAFTRTGVVLVGAPSRPTGVVLRFELALRDGTSVMRGEGRVVGHRAATSTEEAALLLRFTRLDVKSKGFLDRAVALRDGEKAAAAHTPAPAAAAPEKSAHVATPSPHEAHETHDAHEDVEEVEPTVQAPPVTLADAIKHHPSPSPEHAPAPSPSPEVPAPPVHAPPMRPASKPPEPAAPVRKAPEHAPPPSPSPEKPRTSLDAAERDSALDRLRARARKLKDLPSMFAEGERSSAADRASLEGRPAAESTLATEGGTLASFVEGHEPKTE